MRLSQRKRSSYNAKVLNRQSIVTNGGSVGRIVGDFADSGLGLRL